MAINAKTFCDILRHLPESNVKLESDEKNRCFIQSGDAEYTLNGMGEGEYPELPYVMGGQPVIFPQLTLKDMIRQVIFSVSNDDSKTVHKGVKFEITSGYLKLVALDGYRLAIRRESVQGGADGLRFIIPGSALLDVERLCADSDEEVLLNVGTKHSSFTIGGTVVVSRKLEGDFLNYKKSLPENFRYVVKLLREDMLGKVDRPIPTMIDYRTHVNGSSMFNTPPVFAIYVMHETLLWLKQLGGVEAMYEMNKRKAELLYAEIDRNKMFTGTARREDRSIMNVCFVMADEYKDQEAAFMELAKARGMVGIKGHRSVGGFRASIYNACPLESVQALVDCMKEFEGNY